MDAFQAIVLGIVQGLTEFLPVSSTGHLRIVPAFLGWEDPGSAFTAVTQLGTLAAVLIYFRADLWRIATRMGAQPARPQVRRPTTTRGWAGSSSSARSRSGSSGWLFNDQIESGARSLYLIGTTLIVLGLLLLAAEQVAKRDRDDRASSTAATRRSWASRRRCALMPGVSRSGSTITAGLFLGLDRESAARYSFLLSVPAVVLSGLFEARKIGEPGGADFVPTLIATVLAFIVGLRVDRLDAALADLALDRGVRRLPRRRWARWC